MNLIKCIVIGATLAFVIACKKPTKEVIQAETIIHTKVDDSARKTITLSVSDSATLSKMILDSLATITDPLKFGFDESSALSDLTHSVVGIAQIPDESVAKCVAIVGTSSRQNDCHACSGKVSWVELTKKDSLWLISKLNIGLTDQGSWGYVTDCSIELIGPKKYAAIFKGNYGNQGYFSNYSEYLFFTDSITSSFSTSTNSSDGGAIVCEYFQDVTSGNYESIVNYFDIGDSLYQIEVTKFGVQEAVPFLQKETFKFNGKEYARIASESTLAGGKIVE